MSGGPGANQTVLKLTSISKHFGGVRALSDVSFDLRRGEVHALVGENGAGKSTLIKIMTGAVARDGGEIEIHGRAVAENDPALSRSLGIAAIYQQPALFPDLSVAENIGMRCEGGGAFRLIGWNRRRRAAAELLKRLAAVASPDAPVRDLAMAEQQLVEIACALGSNASILILDEPTASLSDREVENLFRIIGELKSRGVAMIYVSHRMEELFRIADRVTVLRDGRLVGDYPMSQMNKSELIRLMVGRELSGVFPKSAAKIGNVILETRQLFCSASRVRGVNLTVRAGEILGLAGLVGAGRTELARTLFGLTPADAGEILLRGNRVAIESPARAVQLGIAYVPEDRRRHGVILDLSVAANTTLAILKKLSTGGLLNFGRERKLSADWMKQLGTKAASVDSAVGTLSGGNQQKVALARWLATNPAVLILDEPTQGVDVGAKAEIHRLMDELAGRGLAIIMISSELPEILGMSDRIIVMHGGAVTGELSRAEATQEKVLELALGHTAAKGAA
jgi:rhamnose transport system ATP-binding protein